MSLMTLEGIVKDGQIQLKSAVDLPENAKVYVIFPEIQNSRTLLHRGRYLVHPEQAKEFTLEMIDISDEWSEQDLAEFSKASMIYATTTILAEEQDSD